MQEESYLTPHVNNIYARYPAVSITRTADSEGRGGMNEGRHQLMLLKGRGHGSVSANLCFSSPGGSFILQTSLHHLIIF